MTECIADGYLEWSEEVKWAEQCMLVETDLWFKQMWQGRPQPEIKFSIHFAEPVIAPGNLVMASMGETSVRIALINEESPLD